MTKVEVTYFSGDIKIIECNTDSEVAAASLKFSRIPLVRSVRVIPAKAD